MHVSFIDSTNMEDKVTLLPSEIARLLYGELLKIDATIAQAFLQTSPHMEECREMQRLCRPFHHKVQGVTLREIIDSWSDLCHWIFKISPGEEPIYRNVVPMLKKVLKSIGNKKRTGADLQPQTVPANNVILDFGMEMPENRNVSQNKIESPNVSSHSPENRVETPEIGIHSPENRIRSPENSFSDEAERTPEVSLTKEIEANPPNNKSTEIKETNTSSSSDLQWDSLLRQSLTEEFNITKSNIDFTENCSTDQHKETPDLTNDMKIDIPKTECNVIRKPKPNSTADIPWDSLMRQSLGDTELFSANITKRKYDKSKKTPKKRKMEDDEVGYKEAKKIRNDENRNEIESVISANKGEIMTPGKPATQAVSTRRRKETSNTLEEDKKKKPCKKKKVPPSETKIPNNGPPVNTRKVSTNVEKPSVPVLVHKESPTENDCVNHAAASAQNNNSANQDCDDSTNFDQDSDKNDDSVVLSYSNEIELYSRPPIKKT